MIRVVLDTNQLISGALWPSGPAGFILEKWREGGLELVVSQPIIEELERVLLTRFEKGHEAFHYLSKVFTLKARLVSPTEKIGVIEEDPSDNMFLEAAVEAGAGLIVSRDWHLLKLGEFRGIQIITAEKMAALLRKT